jgi:hypothetical protein
MMIPAPDAWACSMAGSLAELQDDQVPASGFLPQPESTMHPQARQTLQELRSLTNIEKYLNAARAELASDPCDERLRAFIVVVEGLLKEEKGKLVLVDNAAA